MHEDRYGELFSSKTTPVGGYQHQPQPAHPCTCNRCPACGGIKPYPWHNPYPFHPNYYTWQAS